MASYQKASPWSYVVAVVIVVLLGLAFVWMAAPGQRWKREADAQLDRLNPNANNAPVAVGLSE